MALSRTRSTERLAAQPQDDDVSPKRVTMVDQRIGERLRTARIASGLSLEALATALGVSYQLVQKYECGATRISAARLIQAAHALAVEPSYFFAPDDGAARSVPDAEVVGALSPTKLAAIKMVAEADDADVNMVLQMLIRLNRDDAARAD